jgi:hypothetical protein
MPQFLQAGAGARLLINNQVVGFASGISFTRSQNLKTIYELDNMVPAEISPTTYSVQGTLTGFRIRGSGGLDGFSIMDISTLAKAFTQKYVIIELIDMSNGKTFASITNCLFEADSWQVASRALVTFNGNFRGIFVTNEASTT